MDIVGLENLPPIMLSGNFPDTIVLQGSAMDVSVFMNNQLLFEETYEHSGDFLIYLKFKELFHSLLETEIPLTGDIFEQTKSVADFGIQIIEASQPVMYSFRLVKGGIDSQDVDSESFLLHNFLTWKPQVKKVKYLDPQWLTYYSTGKCNLIMQATWLEGSELVTSEPVGLYVLPVLSKNSLNVKFERLWQNFAQDGRAPYYIDIWVESFSNEKLTYTQRYVLSNEYNEFDDLFVFENSLGGVDVIRFTGELENQTQHEYKNALFGNETREYEIVFNQVFSKNTGYFRNGYEMLWTKDFLSSLKRYQYISGVPVRIVLKSIEAKDIKTELNHFSFTYSFASQSRYLNNAAVIGQLPSIMAEFSGMPSIVGDDIYVRIFGDQVVDGVKTFLQPVLTNVVQPASGDNLILNDLVVQEGGIIDCGQF